MLAFESQDKEPRLVSAMLVDVSLAAAAAASFLFNVGPATDDRHGLVIEGRVGHILLSQVLTAGKQAHVMKRLHSRTPQYAGCARSSIGRSVLSYHPRS